MAPISQPVVVPPSEAAVVLVLTLREGDDQPVLDAIADLTGVIRAVAFRYPDAQTTCVAGIGSHAWDRLFPGAPKPKGLHPFIALDGGAHVAPSTRRPRAARARQAVRHVRRTGRQAARTARRAG